MTEKNKLILSSILISILIFFIYGDNSKLHFLLGEIDEIKKIKILNDCTEIFCRGVIYNVFVYVFFNILNIKETVILAQIFLLVFATNHLCNQLSKNKINKLINFFIIIFILINPKLLKYSFNHGEEGLIIPMLILYCSYILKFIVKKKKITYIKLNIITVFITLIKLGTLPLILFTFVLTYFLKYSFKKKFFISLLSISIILLFLILNSYYLIKLDKTYKKNYYLYIHVLSAAISHSNLILQEKGKINELIDKKIIRKKIIKDEISKDYNNQLFFQCIIFPALNNYIYTDVDISEIFKNDINSYSISEIPRNYIKRFFKEPLNFFVHYSECLYANFLFIEFQNEDIFIKNLPLLTNQNLTRHEREIIKSFLINSPSKFKIISFVRLVGIFILISFLVSFFISFKGFMLDKKKTDLDKCNIIYFFIYLFLIFIHVNLVHVQTRWFFSYFPIVMISISILANKIINSYLRRFGHKF